MSTVLAGITYKSCMVYINNIIIASATFDQHPQDLENILQCLRSADLTLNLDKCMFCGKEFTFIGHVITPAGIKTDSSKIKVTKFANFLVCQVTRHAQLTDPPVALTQWDTNACESAMEKLKQLLVSVPILKFPDFFKPFSVHTDACKAGLGATLMQQDEEGRDYAIAYASHTLHQSEHPYSMTEKECLAVTWALEYFRPYLKGTYFTVYMDHSSLCWTLQLQEFDFSIDYCSGKVNCVTDTLSQNPAQGETCPVDLLLHYSSLSSIHPYQEALGALRIKITNLIYTLSDDLLYYIDMDVNCHMRPMKTLLTHYHDHPQLVTKEWQRPMVDSPIEFTGQVCIDISNYVRSCTTCQLTKPSQQNPAGFMVLIHATYPWKYVGVDFLGPLPRTQGNCYILLFVDYFTKCTKTFAVSSATIGVVTSIFIGGSAVRHGAPKYLTSDRRSPFISELFEFTICLLGTEYQLTTAFHPQTNMTE
uniref:Integrase catalytic domain-containing protein n=1 Tax=Latimeria chalumnae TaxID=7897 RepID=H2ZSA4_LATCH